MLFQVTSVDALEQHAGPGGECLLCQRPLQRNPGADLPACYLNSREIGNCVEPPLGIRNADGQSVEGDKLSHLIREQLVNLVDVQRRADYSANLGQDLMLHCQPVLGLIRSATESIEGCKKPP